MAELLDLFPTLVDLCHLPKPTGLEGVSLSPVLQDPAKSVQLAAFTQHPRPAYYDVDGYDAPQVMGMSVRTTQVRYTEWRDWKSGKTIARELYEASDEPAETRNLVDDPRLAAAQREASALLWKQFPTVKH